MNDKLDNDIEVSAATRPSTLSNERGKPENQFTDHHIHTTIERDESHRIARGMRI